MGGRLPPFDFNQASMSQNLLTHRRHLEGLEAPRNSLELPIGTLQSYCAVGDNIPYSYQVKQKTSKNNCYPSETSMKKLIDEEISKGPENRRNAPSIVARLMGMDMLPSDTKSGIHAKEKRNENAGRNFSRREQTGNGTIGRSPFGSRSFKQTELYVPSHCIEKDSDQSISGLKHGKPRTREHPQEEELQKFKKDFEAWQAARVWECTRVIELGSIPRQWLAQENLNKDKMSFYADSQRKTVNEKPIELKGRTSLPKLNASLQERGVLQGHGYRKEQFQAKQKESKSLRSRTKSIDFEQQPLMKCNHKQGKSVVPTKIVILKPGMGKSADSKESWAGSSEIVEEGGSIEDLLEEVKERLRCEIQGKSAKSDVVVRQDGIEVPFSEMPSNPKLIAQHIAKQVRESVTRDLGMNLLRSESTRSYRSDVQINGPGSPEFINRDTRKFLTDRLRNVLKSETHVDFPMVFNGSSINNHSDRPGPIGDVMKIGNRGDNWGNVKDENEIQTGSFRHGQNNDGIIHLGELSPRNLIRSLSAPVSGTSFGKLLLEDRHVLTGAHIKRKHEATENVSGDVRKTRKERFNFRGKVSNFRYSFNLKGKLFGRKIQSVDESGSDESDPVKDIMSGPTVVMNPGIAQENSTEVPPSPASVCSSAHEELCRPADHPSPISTLDVPLLENHTVPQVFREISSNLHELRRQLNQLEFDGSEDTAIEEEAPEVEMLELEDQAEAYLRDLLVASGLYDGTCDWSISRWDPLAKPLSNLVFEEVENSYRKKSKENGGATKDQNESKVDHKVLFDLLNEALAALLGPAVTMSLFKRKVLGLTVVPPLRGKKMLDSVWQRVRAYVHLPTDESTYLLDRVVARDLAMIPWLDMMHDDADTMGREMEWMILGELIEETVRDMLL